MRFSKSSKVKNIGMALVAVWTNTLCGPTSSVDQHTVLLHHMASWAGFSGTFVKTILTLLNGGELYKAQEMCCEYT